MRNTLKHCGIQGCTEVVRVGQRCPDHRSGWSNSPRTASSRRTGTATWKRIRVLALQRDGHQCQIRGPRCTVQATEVDHVMPVYLGGTDDLGNTESACHNCHSDRTQAQATAARNGWKRTPEPHPGLLPVNDEKE